MSDNGVVWEAPPRIVTGGARRGQPRKWVPRLQPLTARPLVWARVDTKPTAKQAGAMAHALRTSRSVILPPGQWEFTSRAMPDGSGAIYARYLGPEDGAP